MQLLERVAGVVAGFTPGRRLQLYLTGGRLGSAARVWGGMCVWRVGGAR